MKLRLKRIAPLATACLSLFLVAAICTPPPDDNPDGGGGGGNGGDPPDELFEALCGVYERCVTEWGRVFESQQTCATAYRDFLSCGPGGELGEYDPVEGERCMQWLNSAGCDVYIFGEEAPPNCENVYSNNSAGVGQRCGEDGDDYISCAEGLYCDRGEEPGVCPVCAAEIAVGGSCDYMTSHLCVDDAYCDTDASQCAARKADGQPCTDQDECQSGYCPAGSCSAHLLRDASCSNDDVCAYGLVCRGGVCTDHGGTGEVCDDYDDCYSLTHLCVNDTCVATNMCEPGQVGQPCAMAGEAPCAGDAYCDYQTVTCQSPTPIGQPCSAWSECGSAAYCDFMTQECAALPGVGEVCNSGVCVAEAFCDYSEPATPTCVRLRANGQSCSGDMECESELCDESSSQCASVAACVMP